MTRELLLAGVAVTVLACCQRSVPAQPVGLVTSLDSDFEDDDLSVRLTDSNGPHKDLWDLEECCSHSIQTVASPGKAGHSVRFEQRCEDQPIFGGWRAELKKRLGSLMGKTQNYSFRIYLPEDWQAGQTAAPIVVAQWHELPDRDLGEDWRTSPLALQLREGRWAVATDFDPQPKSSPDDIRKNARILPLAPFRGDVGRWVTWRFRVTWRTDDAGSIEVWKDGEQVLQAKGPIGYNDRDGPYFKAGVYRGESRECPVTTLMDDFRFTDETR